MYPVVYSAQHEAEGRSRLTVFFRLLLSIPWLIVAAFWGIAVFFALIGSWFALLFTGRYPQGLYDFNSRFLRFASRVSGWQWLLVDEWPPFNGEPDANYPIRLQFDEPKAEYSRAKVFFRIFLLIPVYILTYIMSIILQLVGLVAWFVLVFTAKLPEGLYKPMRAAAAYSAKAGAYYLLLTEDFPPFWVDEAEEAPLLDGGAPSTATMEPPPPPPPPPPTPATA